jgi:excisionase family DNA binding protein
VYLNVTRRCLVTSSQTPAPQRPRFYSVAEAAAILGVSEVTLYRGINAGEFPAVPIRGRYVVPAKAIDKLEADALARSSSDSPTPGDDWSAA